MTVVAKPLLPVNLHIGGKQISQGSAGVFQHVYAHSGEIQAEIPLAGRQEMNEAVEVAAKAFQKWRRWKPADRRDILLSLGNLIASKAETESSIGRPVYSAIPRPPKRTESESDRRRLPLQSGQVDGETSSSSVNLTFSEGASLSRSRSQRRAPFHGL